MGCIASPDISLLSGHVRACPGAKNRTFSACPGAAWNSALFGLSLGIEPGQGQNVRACPGMSGWGTDRAPLGGLSGPACCPAPLSGVSA